MARPASFFQTRQKELKIAASLYVAFLLLSHWQLPSAHVWFIAAFFSIAMNFTYFTESYARNAFLPHEAAVAAILIALSLLGVIASPLFVIFAVLAHGCWDIAKHLGAGVPFASWYTISCFLVDTVYGASLLIYWAT